MINDLDYVTRAQLEEVITALGNHIGRLQAQVEDCSNRPIHVTCKCDCCCNKPEPVDPCPEPEPVDPCPPVDKDRIGSQGRSRRKG